MRLIASELRDIFRQPARPAAAQGRDHSAGQAARDLRLLALLQTVLAPEAGPIAAFPRRERSLGKVIQITVRSSICETFCTSKETDDSCDYV